MTTVRPRCFSRRGFLGTLSAGICAAGVAGAQSRETPSRARFEAFLTPQTQRAIARGLDYLAGQQNPDGSFGAGDYGRNVAICGLCGMALLASGSTPGRGPYGEQLERVIDFLLECSHDSGFLIYADAASRGPMYGHGFATLFLADVYGMARQPQLRERLSKAVELIVLSQNTEGGWRYEPRRHEADVSVTVCQLVALRAARNAGLFVPNDTVDRATQYVLGCQNPDGGFMYRADVGGPSDFPRSAAALVALYAAGRYEGDEVRTALAYLMARPPRPNTPGRQSYFMYGQYYAAQAMWIAGGDVWRAWYPAIRDVLLGQQEADGRWLDSFGAEYGTATACLILQVPKNYLPIFRR